MIGAILGILKNALGITDTVVKAENAPDMKEAAKNRDEAARQDEETKAVADEDVEQIQKNIASN